MLGAGLPAEFGNARTTRVGVVDEDGGAVGVDMVGGGDAAEREGVVAEAGLVDESTSASLWGKAGC